MSELHLPWLELSIVVPLIGAVCLSRVRRVEAALKIAVAICTITFALACGEFIDFLTLGSFEAHDHVLFNILFPREVFVIDELSAILLPLGALIHLVVVMSTLKTKAPRFSLGWSLVAESLLLAIFSCRASWTLVVLLVASVIPPFFELHQRGRCTRIYVVHMSLFAGLLLTGWILLSATPAGTPLALVPGALLSASALLRAGIVPLHLWMTDLYEKAAFGTAILFCAPLVGAYAMMRLVLPIAPEWALQCIAILSIVTAVYAAGMALVQQEARRMFCYLCLCQSSLVLAGLELVTPIGLTGALCVWLSVGLSLTGFGITLRCIEARIGRVSLDEFHGLYRQMPTLAGFFLLTGLASIGFPATVGFVGMELLIEGAVDVYPLIGTMVVLAAALNGIVVLMAYFRIFTGRQQPTNIPMHARPAERVAVLLLTLLILGGGLYPHPGVALRYHAARELTQQRNRRNLSDPDTSAGSEAEQQSRNQNSHR
ncbi:proton-conducting transporter transmembrane domain-containing protein [Rubinisphaera margarita]|uniref:proton-conducting transporter transmembrane domain-containing protein n=1 Tax=Rubinisphaera margarita TaxID=2909586 RepID=UPI001EE9A753|nr:proton-conducting transporter membrane subunit [Rubinisphaera margarita]MCG6156471.1 oxidoreductase [Rubinisphaera margarita]